MMSDVRIYQTRTGKQPFNDWMARLKDPYASARINTRLRRFYLGQFGDYKSLGNGIFELRIHCGPGYRIYFAEHGHALIVLLLGGDKRSQTKDISKATAYWHDYKEQYHEQD